MTLQEERDFLLRSLDDLEREHDAGDVDEVDYGTLRDDYTARAAAVLRAIEESAEPAPAPAAPPAPGRLWRVLAWAAVVVVVAGVSGLLVARSSGERQVGDEITGAVTADAVPDLLLQAQGLLGDDPVGAIRIYDRVLASEPENVEALTYRGWLLYNATVTDEGLASIERALEVDPDAIEARTFRGLIRRQRGDLDGALSDFEAVLRRDPPPDIAQLVATAYQETQAAVDGTPATAPPASAP